MKCSPPISPTLEGVENFSNEGVWPPLLLKAKSNMISLRKHLQFPSTKTKCVFYHAQRE